MTNYEAIMKMNIDEVGATFNIFLKPFMEALGFTAEQKAEYREYIKTFLRSEVKRPNEDRASKKQP